MLPLRRPDTVILGSSRCPSAVEHAQADHQAFFLLQDYPSLVLTIPQVDPSLYFTGAVGKRKM